jgi:hypothetical protein
MTISKSNNIRSLLLAATIFVSPVIMMAAPPAAAQIGVGLSVQIAPPILPIYAQPPMPGEGYLWTPGYWHWNQTEAYYWVPGTWVRPPSIGVLWTPPYWGWGNGGYLFHDGYWGANVGFYGGINYGFGYGGVGFGGGRWENGAFAYNRSVNNFGSVHVTNTYDENVRVVNNSHVAYVGGEGGLKAEPTAEERKAEQEHHEPATEEQTRHITAAAADPAFAASRNHGHPVIAATARAGEFKGEAVAHAEHAGARAPETRPGAAPREAQHEAAPRPEQHAAAPRPERHAAAPRPERHAAAPRPERHAAAPRPEQHAAAPRAEQHAAAPHPAEHAAPEKRAENKTER